MKSSHHSDPAIHRKSIATRLSPVEIAAVAAAANRLGITRSDWLRQAVQQSLAQPSPSSATPGVSLLLAELLALRQIVGDLFANAAVGLPAYRVIEIMQIADAKKGSVAETLLRTLCDPEPSHGV